jgi:predicted HAD superfamily hydrolase
VPEIDNAKPAWQYDESLRALGARLAASRTRPRLVSFDFFDTLMFRLCAEPGDLFAEVGRQLEQHRLLRCEMSPGAFRAVRATAEAKAREAIARSGRCPELKLADIYAELGEVVSDRAAATELEFAIERRVCFANPAMISFVQHVRQLGCQTAIVSDTYFTAEQLVRLLEDQDVPRSLFDRMFVSCERGRAKWHNGTLYQDLLRQFDAHPGEVLHVGDNLHADIYMARRIGIDTLHYYRTTPALKSIFHGERKQALAAGPSVGSLDTVRVLAARRAEGHDDAYRDGALVLGPVLSRFADWCIGKYARAGVTRVLALMREGELLGDLLRHSAAAAGVNLEIVTCYASRMATARAAMPEVNAESAAALLEGSHQITPQAILDILGLRDEGAQFLDAEMRAKPLPSHEAAVDLLRILFRMPLIRDRIALRHRESQDLAFEYLAELVGDVKKVGVLDLGWSGSIQRNIARILRRKGKDVRTIGCYLACTTRAARLAIEGQEAHAYLGNDWDRVAILPEVCITACVGSTTGYARDASGRVQPVLEPVAPMPDQIAIKGRIREGVLSFQELWLGIGRRPEPLAFPAELLADIDRRSPAILYRWMDFPTKPEADRLGSLYHDENYFGDAKSATLCDEENRALFRREGAGAVFDNTRCYWPQGIMAQVYPRIVSVVRSGWHDARDVGRLGASSPPGSEETGLTDSELASLEHWLVKFGSRQIVLAGPLAPSVVELVNGLAKRASFAEREGAPRLIFAGGCSLCPTTAPSQHCGSTVQERRDPHGTYTCVAGHYSDPQTLRAVRALLDADAEVALVISGYVAEADVQPLLHGLSPFLGPKGVVLAAAGRYDRDELEAESAIGRPIQAWLAASAPKLGFAPLLIGPVDRTAARDWIVLWHSPDAMDWSRQWMPVVADLGYEPEPVADRAESPAGGSPKQASIPPPNTTDCLVPAEP